MTRKIAVQDIYAAPGVLAFRVGDPVPDSAVENLKAQDKVANETTKTAQTAVAEKAKVEKAPPA
jgi:hypothetical protein